MRELSHPDQTCDLRRIVLWLSAATIFMFPAEEILLLPGAYGSFSRALGLLVALMWFALVVFTGQLRRPHPLHFAILLFIIWHALSVFWSVDVGRTVVRVMAYLRMFGLCIILWDLMRTRTALRIGLQAYVLGNYVPIIIMVWSFLSGIRDESGGGRYCAGTDDPNGVGLTIALSLPMAWYLAVTPASGRNNYLLRILNYAHIPIALFAISLTASRGSMVASLPLVFLILATLSYLKPAQSFAIITGLVVAFVLLFPFVPQRSINRLSTTGNEIQNSDLNGRVAIWGQGLTVFAKNPLLGIGSSAFPSSIESGRAAHNTPLSILVDVGLVGFVLFVLLIGMTVYQALRTPRIEMWCWLTVVLIWCIGAMVHNWEHTKHTWFVVSLVTIGANLSVRQMQSRDVANYARRADDRLESGLT